ncbi:MAG: asparaginase [Anaerolineales bacterium]|nr:asparaginase [Anaerolineales bacterium]
MSASPVPYAPLIEYTRGGLVESVHAGALAVADAAGRLVAAWGDPQAVVFLRSSAKPFQAVPLVESGAADAAGLTPRELALTCASHRGLDMHVAVVSAMQAKIGAGEADLQCGTHPLDDPDTVRQLILAGQAPTPNRHNCSGKHTGMLALARHLGQPLDDYLNPHGPVQRAILEAFAALCGVAPAEVVVGIDGCSAPNFAVPLAAAARAFARLADPAGLPPARAAALRRLYAAMTAHPEMVRAPGGFDTELMRRLGGRLVAKGGAEGYQAIGLAPGALGPGSPALGLTLKVADGGSRAVGLAAAEALRQLGALTPAEWAGLEPHGFTLPQPVTNWRGLVVGEARAAFHLPRLV